MIGGEGPEKLSLKRLVKILGVEDQVSFLGKLSRVQVVEVISSSDSFVLPSHYETFGVVLIEALALGKPVIATRCGGPESIVLNSDGFLVERNNKEVLANAMKKMIDHISDYDPQEIRKSCLSRFGAPIIVKQLIALYDQVNIKY